MFFFFFVMSSFFQGLMSYDLLQEVVMCPERSMLARSDAEVCDRLPLEQFLCQAETEGVSFVEEVFQYLEYKGLIYVKNQGWLYKLMDNKYSVLYEYGHLLMSKSIYEIAQKALREHGNVLDKLCSDVYGVLKDALLHVADNDKTSKALSEAMLRWKDEGACLNQPRDLITFALDDLIKAEVALIPYIVEKFTPSNMFHLEFSELYILSKPNSAHSVIGVVRVDFFGEAGDDDKLRRVSEENVAFGCDFMACHETVGDAEFYERVLECCLLPSKEGDEVSERCVDFFSKYVNDFQPVRDLVSSMREFLGEKKAIYYEQYILSMGCLLWQEASKAEGSLWQSVQRMYGLALSVSCFREDLQRLVKWSPLSPLPILPEKKGFAVIDLRDVILSKSDESCVCLGYVCERFIKEKKYDEKNVLSRELSMFSHLFIATSVYAAAQEVLGDAGIQINSSYIADVADFVRVLKSSEGGKDIMKISSALQKVERSSRSILPFLQEKGGCLHVVTKDGKLISVLERESWCNSEEKVLLNERNSWCSIL